jgi:hypothetical protein
MIYGISIVYIGLLLFDITNRDNNNYDEYSYYFNKPSNNKTYLKNTNKGFFSSNDKKCDKK